MKRQVKFGIFTDLHVDIMHDTEKRLRQFLEDCRRENVDFIIQLGDFCYPDENRKCVCKPDNMPVNIKNALSVETFADKDTIRSLYRDFEKPSFHVLGNHDCDMCSKEIILEYYNSPHGNFYSFDMGGFHFVVLDVNYMYLDGAYVSYNFGNYFDHSYVKEKPFPCIPDHELNWLKEDLAKTSAPSVLFSHQRLSTIRNSEALKNVLKNAPGKVVLAINGHEHLDYVEQIDDTWYYSLNSMSNYWVDEGFVRCDRFAPGIDEKYPNIKYTIPYTDPVYAFVTLDETGASIKGRQSSFAGPSPEEMELYKEGSPFRRLVNRGISVTAGIRERELTFSR